GAPIPRPPCEHPNLAAAELCAHGEPSPPGPRPALSPFRSALDSRASQPIHGSPSMTEPKPKRTPKKRTVALAEPLDELPEGEETAEEQASKGKSLVIVDSPAKAR